MNISFDYTGKTAVVTGGSKGIGKAISTAFAKAGANVAVVSSSEAGRATADELNGLGSGRVVWFQADVSNESSVLAMRDGVMKEFGKVDYLINNAGVGPKHPGPPLAGIPSEEFKKMYNTNTMGVVYNCKAFYENFYTNKEGRIVNVASIAGILPSPAMVQYGMSKAAIIIFSESLAQEMGSFNVNVNVLNPGFVFTDIYGAGGDKSTAQLLKRQLPHLLGDLTESEDIVKRLASTSWLKRLQTVEDMANTALFLCSDGAANITGQCFNVDGGIIYR